MDILINHINAYILAGGNSSRMGTDKGMMLLNGKPIVQYVLEQLQLTFKNVSIVSNNPEYGMFGVEVIPDIIKGVGPAGGVFAALNHTDKAYNFIVGCDMPFITAKAIKLMLIEPMESDIILPVRLGRLEPLFGIYAKSCMQIWHQLIVQNIIKLQDMVFYFNFKEIDVDLIKQFSNVVLLNINTRNDLEKAINII